MNSRWMWRASAATTLLLGATTTAWPDRVPMLNVNPLCHGIAHGAAGAGERGGPSLSFAQCVRSEQTVRKKLVKEWFRYASTDKKNCIAETTMGGLASYTNLFGCLKSATAARKGFNTPSGNYRIER
jgi:hypothetical protein